MVHADGGTGRISGVVVHAETRAPLDAALVILQCSCLDGDLDVTTDDHGRYAFEGLAPGSYSVRALAGQADEARSVVLEDAGDAWAGIAAEPGDETFCLEPGAQPRSSYCPH